MRIQIPANYPPESLVLFVMSTWHVLIALVISRVGVLRREPAGATAELPASPVLEALTPASPFQQAGVETSVA